MMPVQAFRSSTDLCSLGLAGNYHSTFPVDLGGRWAVQSLKESSLKSPSPSYAGLFHAPEKYAGCMSTNLS